MKYFQIKFLFFYFFLFFTVNAQVQPCCKTQLRNMTERWELDTTSVRGTIPLQAYVCFARALDE
jgi:phospholipase A1